MLARGKRLRENSDWLLLDNVSVAEPITLTRALNIYSDLSTMPSLMVAKEEGRAHHQKNYVELVLKKIVWNWFQKNYQKEESMLGWKKSGILYNLKILHSLFFLFFYYF